MTNATATGTYTDEVRDLYTQIAQHMEAVMLALQQIESRRVALSERFGTGIGDKRISFARAFAAGVAVWAAAEPNGMALRPAVAWLGEWDATHRAVSA